ncbi:Bug family tripartite tricarboxylate transporter substrate binding protein [Lacisediminimonas profundi]|uniref:Bug family tripartite tricarboxylate transporter substrate binding protein n=1 Tax=Lacisediminimonas profundi TaxID=2603856 RepID=UPI001F4F7782|nr:tripartite tricarboxylate transporter substrate binding protein [Lacisediminimonas profundi]
MKKFLPSCVAAVLMCAGLAHAKYPEKPITLMLPFAPGSATDSVARIVGKALSERIGQPVVVEPKPGANGQIGTSAAARSAPDGYTLFMGTTGTHSSNPALFKRISYDPVKDFAPILLVGEVPFVLVANNNVPARSLDEFIRYGRQNPDKLFYAYAAPTSQVAGETFVRMANIKSSGVSYKSSPQAAVDLIAGHSQFYFIDFSTGLPHIRSGSMRAIAVAGERTDMLPGVPPVSSALPGLVLTSWNGIFAPAGTPKEIVNYLNAELRAVLKMPAVRQSLQGIGFEILGTGTPEDFGAVIGSDLKKWAQWIEQAGIKPQ